MNRSSRLWVWLALMPIACESPAPNIEDLVDTVAIAQKDWDGVLIEFGSPAARPFLRNGWSHGETASDGNAFRWAVGRKASFRFDSRSEGKRLGWLECEAYRFAGAPTQAIALTVNGHELPALRLREGRSRYPVELPLVEGENEVAMQFRYAKAPRESDSGSEDRRRLAVAFYRFDVPFEDDGGGTLSPGPFAVVSSSSTSGERVQGVFLPPGSGLSFFGELPAGARLAVEGGLRTPRELRAPVGASLAVRVDSADGTRVERRVDRGDGVLTLELPLSALEGHDVRISIRVARHPLVVRPRLHFDRPAPHPEPRSARRFEWEPDEVKFLVLVLDGAAASRMSVYGYPKPTTPRLEELASQSVVFENAISQAVYTIASVGSLLTGQYPERHQSVSFADRLPASAVTVPGLLTQAGFLTAAFSGNAVVSSAFGLDRGYQSFYSARDEESYTGHGDSLQRLFLEWLETHHEERFFAYVHFREPHFPYNPPAPFDTRFGPGHPFPNGLEEWEDVAAYNRAATRGEPVPDEVVARIRSLYEGNLAYVDRLLGQILEALERWELLENTVIVLTADHGEAMFEHRFIGHNTQLYEESVRVPLFVRLPGVAPRRVAQVVELIDLAPTILELAGALGDSVMAGMQGRSLVPLFHGGRAPPKPAFSRTLWDKPRYSVRTDRYKYIWDSRVGSEELYDLVRDPMETTPIQREEPVMRGKLRQELFHWLREQERLGSAAPPSESAEVPEDLSRVLDSLGYVQYRKGNDEREKQRNEEP